MLFIQQLALFALASSVLAAPHRGQSDNLPAGCVREGRVVVCTVTVTAGQPAPTQPAAPVVPAPAPSSAAPSPSPAAAAAGSSNSGGSQSGGQANYMSVVSQMRSAGGLSQLQQDSTLEANARKTASDCARNGNKLTHELNPGSFAQVLATGSESGFHDTYVKSWLCEIPSLPGLSAGMCDPDAGSGGETGHAEILTSTKYKKIGCAFVGKVWSCDLA